ncbi:MAG TPA: cytochrome c-type biogenesis protein CcmH [Candidatus Limnocylindria bacterium]|nr:cytochrome c-type biogenesis protein CcmH [Candidatus Limnocylindria bacterium]
MNAARWALLAAVLAVGVAALFAAWPAPAGPEERVERIVAELRCPVCQGLSVADSPSESARQMRDLVAQRVAEGRTDAEIREEFRRSYGDWVFLAPETGGPAALMWLAPLLLVAAGLAIAWSRTRARSPDARGSVAGVIAPQPPPAAVEQLRARVAREEAADL